MSSETGGVPVRRGWRSPPQEHTSKKHRCCVVEFRVKIDYSSGAVTTVTLITTRRQLHTPFVERCRYCIASIERCEILC